MEKKEKVFRILTITLIIALFSLVILMATGPAFGAKKTPPGLAKAKYKDGEILVKFKTTVKEDQKERIHKSKGGEKIREFSRLNLHHVKIKKGMSVEEAINTYKANPDVDYAEPNFELSLDLTPHDPRYGELWGMNKIQAPDAWEISTGDNTVVVGVIDTGIDYNHPDLIDNMWINEAEYLGIPGVDDDGNGWIDDIHGMDGHNRDGDPMDDHSHGTHVAGTIGAVGNNGVGVTGVTWNVKLMGLKFLGASGSGWTTDAILCLEYIREMKDRGVNIVASNNSWGGGGYSQALSDAINNQSDILFVAAAGNNTADNDLIPHYPSSYQLPNVVSVAATGSSDTLAYFSNWGRQTVHLAAPGYAILSTTPNNSYGIKYGTSMASPHVAGLAALITTHDHGISVAELKDNLMNHGDPLPESEQTKIISGRRINALASLQECSGGSSLLRPTEDPLVARAGESVIVKVESNVCGQPYGPVWATVSAGEQFELVDNGFYPDDFAEDGIFTGEWIPPENNLYLSVSSPAKTIIIETVLWKEQLSKHDYTEVPGMEVDSGGNLVISGYFWTGERDDIRTRKYDQQGNLVWERIFSDPVNFAWYEVEGLAIDSYNNIYIVSSCIKNETFDTYLHKYDADGNLQWERFYDLGLEDQPEDITIDRFNNIYIAGKGWNPADWDEKSGFILKLNQDGDIIWDLPLPIFSIIKAVDADLEGNLYAVQQKGILPDPYEFMDVSLLKINPDGSILWEQEIDLGRNSYAFQGGSIAIDEDNNVYLSGLTNYKPSPEAYLTYTYKFNRKYSPQGILLWEKINEYNTRQTSHSIGLGDSLFNISDKGHISAYDRNGNQWHKRETNYPVQSSFHHIIPDNIGNIYIATAYNFSLFKLAIPPLAETFFPDADAGNNQTVPGESLVTLDAGNSSTDGSDIAAYLWKQISGPPVTLSDSSVAQPSFLAPGSSQPENLDFNVKITDQQGRQSDDIVTIHTERVPNRPPVFDPIGDQQVNENNYFALIINATDPDSAPLTYSALNLPAGANFTSETRTFEWIPTYSQAGEYTVLFEVTDGEATDSEEITITVMNINQTPVLDPIGNSWVLEGETLSFTVTAFDADGDDLNIFPNTLPTGAQFDHETAHFSWTPGFDQAGDYVIRFSATDGHAYDFEDVTISVTNINMAPVFDPIGPQEVVVGETLVISIDAYDPDGDFFVYDYKKPPPGAIFNTTTGVFYWTPTIDQVGVYSNLLLGATDGQLPNYENVVITVTVGNIPPVLTPIGNRTINTGETLSLDISATDANNDPLTFSVTNLPPGATFNAATGAFIWTPASDQAGSYPVRFEVSDGDKIDAEDIVITVIRLNHMPVIAPIGDKSVTIGETLNFTVTATDSDGDPLIYVLSGVPSGAFFNSVTQSFTWTPTVEQIGSYSVLFEVSDSHMVAREEITITVHGVNHPPIFGYISNRQHYTGSELKFYIIATDADGDLLTFGANNLPTGATFNPATLWFTWTPVFEQAGEYVVEFTVTDGLAQVTHDTTITIVQEVRAPVLAPIGNKGILAGNLLSFAVTATDDNNDPLTYSADGLPAGAEFDSASGLFNWTPTMEQIGSYTVTFHAADHLFTDSETITITVTDSNGPPVLSPIGSRSVNEGDLLTITLSATDPDGDTLTFSATGLPPGAEFDPATAVFSWTPTADQAGTYMNLLFTVSDGQETNFEEIFITVNNINHAPVFDPIGGKTVAVGQTLTFAVNAHDPDGDFFIYDYKKPPPGSSFNTTSGVFTWTPTTDHVGVYTTPKFGATDGQLSNYEQITITVTEGSTNKPPVLDPIGNKSVFTGETLSFTLSATDPDGDSLTFAASNLPAGASFNSGDFSWAPAANQAGTFSVTFSVSDGTETDSESITITVTSSNQAPVLDPIGGKSVLAGEILTFTVSATDQDGDPLSLTAISLPTGSSFDTSTGLFFWTPAGDQVGTYAVRFEVSDGQVIDFEEISITVTGINQPPVLAPVGDKAAAVGSSLTFTVSGSDLDGDPLTYSASNLPAGASLNGAAFSWTPGTDQAGTYSTTFSVNDGLESDSETISITVSSANQPPVLDPIGDKSVLAGGTLHFTLPATDPDGDTLTYSAGNLPSGASFDPALPGLTWHPTADDAGTYSVIFTVSDGEATDTETITITVTNPSNTAPVLAVIGDKSVVTGEMLNFSLNATDADGDTLTYSAADLPAGASLDSGSGVFSWIPDDALGGTSATVRFEVSDGQDTDFEDVTITISAPVDNRAPVFDPIGDKSVAVGETLTFSVDAYDPDGDFFIYDYKKPPPGSTFNIYTGVFTWTPTTAQVGVYDTPKFGATDGQLSNYETITITVIP